METVLARKKMKKLFCLFFIFFSLDVIMAEDNFLTIDINFKKEILENKLQLIIYYNGPKLIRGPMPDEEIREGRLDYKIVINSSILLYNIDLLNRLNSIQYKKGDETFMLYTMAEKRILCEFRNKNDDIVLSFTHGLGAYIILNDIVIQKERSLYEIIKYYLPRNINFYGEI